ncbi:MAG: prenyltransferase, partial [Candidatus Marinimicrobia bacterium]|nr:prenyltransferase [Candidatus Neomarinimicrobiota bacterium]
IIFLGELGSIARFGFAIGFGLLIIANLIMLSKKTPNSALKALPFVHATLFVYIISIYLDVAF